MPRCPATVKRQFPTQEAAEAELAVTAAKAKAGNSRRREQRAYFCVWCSSWHLTAQSEGPRVRL